MANLPQGNLLPLISAGDIVSIWHDVIIFSAATSNRAPSRAAGSPRRAPIVAPLLNFICTSSKSNSFAASLAGRRRRLALDGAVKVDDSEQRPWSLGIIPQTCVLGPSDTPSAIPADEAATATNEDLYPLEDECGESDAAFPVILDNAPMEAVEVGTKERDPGDVFPVLPLLALPVRLRSGLGTEISWKLVVVAADDPRVLANQVAAIAETILPKVKEWAETGGFTKGSGKGDSDRWWVPESPRRESDNWEEAARKALSVVLEAHSIWKLLVGSLRRPTLQRRQRVSERALQGWQDKGDAGDDGSSSLLQLIAKPAGGGGGFGGGATRGSGRGIGGAESGGRGALSRGRCSAAAAAASVSAAGGRSARSDLAQADGAAEGDTWGRELGDAGEGGRTPKGSRQLRRTASVATPSSSARSITGSDGGSKRRGVLPQISPRNLSMTSAARALVKTATWSRGGSSSRCSNADEASGNNSGVSRDEGRVSFHRSKTCSGDDAAFSGARSRSKSPSPRSVVSSSRRLSPPGARDSPRIESSRGLGGALINEYAQQRRDIAAGRVTTVHIRENRLASDLAEAESSFFRELGEIGDASDLGEVVKSKPDSHRAWNSGRLGFSFGSKSVTTFTTSTSSKVSSAWGGLGSSFYSGPLFGMLGKSKTYRASDGQQIPKEQGIFGKGRTLSDSDVQQIPKEPGILGKSRTITDSDGQQISKPPGIFEKTRTIRESDKQPIPHADNGVWHGKAGGNCISGVPAVDGDYDDTGDLYGSSEGTYGGTGHGGGYTVTSHGGDKVRSGARGTAFSRSNTDSSTYSTISMGGSSNSSRSSKGYSTTPDTATATVPAAAPLTAAAAAPLTAAAAAPLTAAAAAPLTAAAAPPTAVAAAPGAAGFYPSATKSHKVDRLEVHGAAPGGGKGKPAGSGGTTDRSSPYTPPLARSKTDPHSSGSDPNQGRQGAASCSHSSSDAPPTSAASAARARARARAAAAARARAAAAAAAAVAAGATADGNTSTDGEEFEFSPLGTPDSLAASPMAGFHGTPDTCRTRGTRAAITRQASQQISQPVSPRQSPPQLTRRWSLNPGVGSAQQGGGDVRVVIQDASHGLSAGNGLVGEMGKPRGSSQASSLYERRQGGRRMTPISRTVSKTPSDPRSPRVPKSPSLLKFPGAHGKGLRVGFVEAGDAKIHESGSMSACGSDRGAAARSKAREQGWVQQGQGQGLGHSDWSGASQRDVRLGRSVSYDYPSTQLAAAAAAEVTALPEPPGRRFTKSQTATPQRGSRMTAARPVSSSGTRTVGGGTGGLRDSELYDAPSRPPRSPLARMASAVVYAQSGGGGR